MPIHAETYCTSCGQYGTCVGNGDNHCCSACGDPEGLIFSDDDNYPGVSMAQCPKCSKHWPLNCEQAIAIEKRGKCIVCIVQDPTEPPIEVNPYEFSINPTPPDDDKSRI